MAMCIYIGIEDLVANALIELVEKSEKKNEDFAAEVAAQMNA